MASCIQQLDRTRCVLLRYAGDGIALMDSAVKQNNALAFVQGRIRFQSALLALHPPARFSIHEAPTVSTDTYRRSLALSTSQVPSADLGADLNPQDHQVSPLEALIRENPIPTLGGE